MNEAEKARYNGFAPGKKWTESMDGRNENRQSDERFNRSTRHASLSATSGFVRNVITFYGLLHSDTRFGGESRQWRTGKRRGYRCGEETF